MIYEESQMTVTQNSRKKMDHYSIMNHLVLYFNDPVLSFSVHFFDGFSAFHLTSYHHSIFNSKTGTDRSPFE